MKENFPVNLDLIKAKMLIYGPAGLRIENIRQEIASLEYGGCNFQIKGLNIQFRAGKITPKKVGQFVTFYKRAPLEIIIPYEIHDPFDFLVVSVSKEERFAQFVFPKSILSQMGILSKDGVEGKRAFRIYPSWDNPTNLQAKKTQKWQLLYFFEVSSDSPVALNVNRLYLSKI